MSSFILDVDQATGVIHRAHIHGDGDELILEEFTPTIVEQSILDNCHRLRGLAQNSAKGMKLAAQIPINTYMAWKKEWREKYRQYMTWQTFEAMKINNSDHKNLRVGDRFQKL